MISHLRKRRYWWFCGVRHGWFRQSGCEGFITRELSRALVSTRNWSISKSFMEEMIRWEIWKEKIWEMNNSKGDKEEEACMVWRTYRERELIWFKPNISLAKYALLTVIFFVKKWPRYPSRRWS